MAQSPAQPGRARALLAFAAFGLFWGSWGAVLPAVQAQADVGDSELGVALLCIGAGALAGMRPAGVALDRWGSAVLPLAVLGFAACAVLPGIATSAIALSAALLLLGAMSGALDVAINTEAVRVEATGRRVLHLVHAGFSGAVVVASLLTGALRSAGGSPHVVLGTVAVLLVITAIALRRLTPAPAVARPAPAPWRRLLHAPAAWLILGGLAALAYLVENAWQSWSALQLEGTLDAAPGLAALGPAVFAGAAMTGRLGGQWLSERVSERTVLRSGATLGALGTLVGATAPTVLVALLGIAVAGLGTSLCAPTLISLAGRASSPEQRGAAVSVVTTLAYLGFLLGPALVGIAAAATTLRIALVGIAGVALLLGALAKLAPVHSPSPSDARHTTRQQQ
jgi:MFS family permease